MRKCLFLAYVLVTVAIVLCAVTTTQAALTNVAVGKTATASSQYSGTYPAGDAIDDYWNHYSNSWVSRPGDTSENPDGQPWWQVDLGQAYDIAEVDLISRDAGGQAEHINGAYLVAYADNGSGGKGDQVGNAIQLGGYTDGSDSTATWRQTWSNGGTWNNVRFIEISDIDDILPHPNGTMQIGEVRVMADLPTAPKFITGVTAAVTSLTTPLYSSGHRDVKTEHLVNNVGMTDQGMTGWGGGDSFVYAASMNGGLWHTEDMYDDTTGALLGDLPELTFDLHGKCDMEGMTIWNISQPGLTMRGFRNVNISYSTDGGTTFTLLPDENLYYDGNYQIAQAIEDSTNDPDLIIDLTSLNLTDVTHFRIQALDSYWGTANTGDEYFGLSEVRFFGDRTPTVRPPGDASNDGAVNELDARILATHWLEEGIHLTYDDGDFNGDYIVDDLDASIMAANWGFGTEGQAVPEPGTVTLLILGVFGFLLVRKLRC
ncbi:MAG: discoidin domain-containing protein [Pirellulales bacterium]|nr:discoidin domain-containing protein [Pirellulales bacterium]